MKIPVKEFDETAFPTHELTPAYAALKAHHEEEITRSIENHMDTRIQRDELARLLRERRHDDHTSSWYQRTDAALAKLKS